MGKKLTVARGSWEPVRVVFKDTDGVAEDLTGYTVYFIVGHTRDGTSEIFRLTSSNVEECTVNAAAGIATFYIGEDDTEDLPEGSYWYDVWVLTPSNKYRQRVSPETLTVGPRVPVDVPPPD